MRKIMELCEETVRMPGTWVANKWRDKEGLDLVGARVAATAEEEGIPENTEEEAEEVAGI